MENKKTGKHDKKIMSKSIDEIDNCRRGHLII